MRILFLANDDEGIYKFRKELIETLLKDNEVFIALYCGGYTEDYIGLLQKMGCKYIETKFNRQGTNPVDDLKLIGTYKKVLQEVKPDIVLTYTIKPNVYGGMACQMLNIPYVVNVTGISSAIENGGILGFLCTMLYKVGIRKARTVFFQNEANRDYMIKHHVLNGPYDIIPGSGVNLKQYSLLEYPTADTIDFAYIGRIMTEKGFKLYIDAAQYIKKKYPNTNFHVCGLYDEKEYEPIVNELHNKGIINYHGSVSNMKYIYKKLECVIHPTYYAEGMSNVLLEASACGRAIITTDRPGCKEVIENGINGFVVKQRDLDDLINKIEKFINLTKEERKQMGIKGREKIAKDFDRQIVIDKYLKVINQ